MELKGYRSIHEVKYNNNIFELPIINSKYYYLFTTFAN